jgi:hypothetical protein
MWSSCLNLWHSKLSTWARCTNTLLRDSLSLEWICEIHHTRHTVLAPMMASLTCAGPSLEHSNEWHHYQSDCTAAPPVARSSEWAVRSLLLSLFRTRGSTASTAREAAVHVWSMHAICRTRPHSHNVVSCTCKVSFERTASSETARVAPAARKVAYHVRAWAALVAVLFMPHGHARSSHGPDASHPARVGKSVGTNSSDESRSCRCKRCLQVRHCLIAPFRYRPYVLPPLQCLCASP